MKKLLIVATLSITVAAVIKRVAKKKNQPVQSFVIKVQSNLRELDSLIDDVAEKADAFEDSLERLENFTPDITIQNTVAHN